MEDFDAFVVHQGARGMSVAFARELVAGTLSMWDRLNTIILPLAKNWKLDRMATVDRNILRIGCYELTFTPEVPASVAINEAVELAKKYGTSRSGAFVNGILDRVRLRNDSVDVMPNPGDPPSEPQ